MFAEGDKVFYQGKGMLRKDMPYYVERVVNEFIFIGGRRYQSSSFVSQKKPVVDVPLLQELTERVTKVGVGTCSYALEFKDGHRRFQIRDVCHARMPYGGRYANAAEQNNELVAVALNVAGHLEQIPKEYVEAYKLHVKYILTQSPWKDAFIQKPLEDVYTSGVYIDISKDYWYCVAAAVALRSGSEFHRRLPTFKRLLDLQYSPNVAYIVSQCSATEDSFAQFGGGHHVFNNMTMTMKSFEDFFNKGELCNKANTPYSKAEGKSYKIFALMCNDLKDDQESVLKYITDKLKHITVEHKPGWGQKTVSIPFDKPDNLIMLANTFAKVIK